MTKDYVAGGDEYQYPELGEPKPPGGAKVLLLTQGHVCVQGNWADNGPYLGWAPLPKRNKEKEAKLSEVRAKKEREIAATKAATKA